MGDSLFRGRHHRVIGCDDDDCDIRNLCTAGTHGRKRLVSRCVKECYPTSVAQLHVIRSYVLRDTSGLTGNHVGVADVVEQRRLTVVDVSHDGNNRSTRHKVVLVVLLFTDSLLHLSAHIFGLESELVGNEVDGLGIESLVDGNHDTD